MAGLRLSLLEGFALDCDAAPVALPMTAQRVLAFVALHRRPVVRNHVAGTLWLDVTEEQCTASLRSALWRLRRPGHVLVEATATHLRLADGVAVDYREALDRAQSLLEEPDAPDAPLLDTQLTHDLLPDWCDDWVTLERERFRQLRLHALEARCDDLARSGRYAAAIDTGLSAIACEPLRETAHRLVITVHLAEGNRTEALRHFDRYCRVLDDELGIAPSPRLTALVHGEVAGAPDLRRPQPAHR